MQSCILVTKCWLVLRMAEKVCVCACACVFGRGTGMGGLICIPFYPPQRHLAAFARFLCSSASPFPDRSLGVFWDVCFRQQRVYYLLCLHNRTAIWRHGFFFYSHLVVLILARFYFEGRLVSKGFIFARFYFEGRLVSNGLILQRFYFEDRLVHPRVPGLMPICTGRRRTQNKTQQLLIVWSWLDYLAHLLTSCYSWGRFDGVSQL